MKSSPDSGGYRSVTLYQDGSQEQCKVSNLVMEAFAGPRPEGLVVRHGTGGQVDDRLENLCWGTYSQNNGVDKERDGTVARGEKNGRYTKPEATARGERNGRCKLTDVRCTEIVARYAAGGITQRELAAEYSVNQSQISLLVRGKSRRLPSPTAGASA
jgi:hypothetical protein